jgi:hypothetical protein
MTRTRREAPGWEDNYSDKKEISRTRRKYFGREENITVEKGTSSVKGNEQKETLQVNKEWSCQYTSITA